MASNINDAIPVVDADVDALPIRTNFFYAKQEIEALQSGKLNTSAIGVTVQAYDLNLTSFVNLFTLPTTDGTNGFVLTTNGAGVLSWTAKGSGGSVAWGSITGIPANITDIEGLSTTDNGVVIGNGTNFVLESGATLRTSLGLAIGSDVQAFDAQTTKNNVANNFTQPNDFVKTSTDWVAEAFNATQTLDANVPAGTTTLTGNMTLNAVSNSTTGEMQVIVRTFTQDATGGRTLAYNTAVFSASGASFPQPTSTANRVSLFQFTKMSDGKWAVQSLNDVRST